MNNILLRVKNLHKSFPVKAGAFSNKKLTLKAVNDVSFDVKKGEIFGLVGESGCGKTTLGRCLLRIYEPDSGRVFLDPVDDIVDQVAAIDHKILTLRSAIPHQKELKMLKKTADSIASHSDILCMNKHNLKQVRRRIAMIFQDPWASLNPRMLIKDIIGEGAKEFGLYKGKQLDDFVYTLIDKVGLPRHVGMRYPHEFSGGQRQRIGIARALALKPSVIICDEPVSALDVSIQAQIINLFLSLQTEFDLSYIFIAHNLSVVHYISDRIGVMYLGKIVELAKSTIIYSSPTHPYTVSLMSAVPVADPDQPPREIILEGDVASPVNPPLGCAFHPRCTRRLDICMQQTPKLRDFGDEHWVSCHNPLTRSIQN